MLATAPPEDRHRAGLLLLQQGRYQEAWPLYQARLDRPGAKPAIPFPEWRGEPLAGKAIHVFSEQGFGDEIQFARFLPLLKAQGADVTLLCRPPLGRLFQRSLGVAVVSFGGDVELPDPDCWALLNSIPALLGLALEQIPTEPYLRADALRVGGVGVVTKGRPEHPNDANRSLPLHAADELLALGRSLLPEDTGARDFAETADIVASLDLVISVDTAVAHLAGAMGKPCWVLLPALNTDWRWLKGRRDSPWYPSMRLYRQRRPGDWRPVLAEIKRDLTR